MRVLDHNALDSSGSNNNNNDSRDLEGAPPRELQSRTAGVAHSPMSSIEEYDTVLVVRIVWHNFSTVGALLKV